MSSVRSNTRLVVGLIVIAFGVLFLLGNLDIIDSFSIWSLFRWQYILILIGVIILTTTTNRSTGFILILIGFIFLFPELWPLILIGLGGYIIFRTGGFSKSKPDADTFGNENQTQAVLNEVAIFGGGKKYIHSDNFQGGKLTAIFGGSEIDLIDSKLSEGEHVLDIFAMFGGFTLLIPADWKIELDPIPIFGGFSDNRRKDPNMVQSNDRILRIKGLVIFGGGEIKN